MRWLGIGQSPNGHRCHDNPVLLPHLVQRHREREARIVMIAYQDPRSAADNSGKEVDLFNACWSETAGSAKLFADPSTLSSSLLRTSHLGTFR